MLRPLFRSYRAAFAAVSPLLFTHTRTDIRSNCYCYRGGQNVRVCFGNFPPPRKKVRIKVGVNKLVAGVDVERGRVKCVHPVLINEVAVWYDVWFSWIRRAPGASRSYAPRCTFWQTTPHVSINDMMIHVLEFSNLSVLKLSFSL